MLPNRQAIALGETPIQKEIKMNDQCRFDPGQLLELSIESKYSDGMKFGLGFAGLVSLVSPRLYVEIGTRFGFSAILASYSADEVISIDIEKKYSDIARSNAQKYGRENIRFLTGDGVGTVSAGGIKDVGVFFVDGDHSYEGAKRDCRLAMSVLSPGGYLLIHDTQHMPQVRKAAEEIIAENRDMVENISFSKIIGGIFALRKTK